MILIVSSSFTFVVVVYVFVYVFVLGVLQYHVPVSCIINVFLRAESPSKDFEVVEEGVLVSFVFCQIVDRSSFWEEYVCPSHR